MSEPPRKKPPNPDGSGKVRESPRTTARPPEDFDGDLHAERFFRKPRDPRREVRLRDLARKLLPERAEVEAERGISMETAKEAIGVLLETGDRAKTEVVRLVAREVRSYLEALELKEYLGELLQNYTLEVNASFRLRPNAEKASDESGRSGERGREKGREPPRDRARDGGGCDPHDAEPDDAPREGGMAAGDPVL
jgi:hypothetical protein